MPKDRMIEALGERRLLLPGLVENALAANDRVKYLLTLIQNARGAADGATEMSDLREERITAGIDSAHLDRVVSQATREPDGSYRIPTVEVLAHHAIEETLAMLAPLDAADVAAASGLRVRVEAVSEALSACGDRIGAEDIAGLTAPRSRESDSLHVIVMDAHRELNALQAQIATESIDGARAHGLQPEDRGLVAAFMRGLHHTERLRFEHPGLDTTATHVGPSAGSDDGDGGRGDSGRGDSGRGDSGRGDSGRGDSGGALLIENDLGTTDAHVVVIRIAPSTHTVTITYTDVHLQRLLFLQELLAPWPVVWEDTRSRSDEAIEGGLFHLASGRLQARDRSELERFLEHLGSRLVFIIDWNRARKRLRRLVGRRAAIELLRWAAEQEYGHIAFLRAGADGLVYDALQFAGGGRAAHTGESLRDVLGAEAATAYMRSVLRICSDGLTAGRAISLVQDEVRAELTGYLRSARQEILALAQRHAELSVEIAEFAHEALEQTIAGADERRRAAAARARQAEHEADVLLLEARGAAARAPELGPFLELVEAADDIADCAEEAAFYAALLPAGRPLGEVREQVRRLARLVLSATREYLRAVGLSTELRRGGPREEMDACLQALHEAIALEHDTDEAQRAVHTALAARPQDAGTLFVIIELTRSFEEAADALMHCAHLLREHVLARVVGSESVALAAPSPPSSPPRREQAQAAGARGEHDEPQTRGEHDEHVYLLGDPSTSIPDAATIGSKAHGLARIARAGLRVPEGAVLQTSFADARARGELDEEAGHEVLMTAVRALQARTGLRLGSSRTPLLVSVRSGAPVSMPGMLETVLDVGMCDACAWGLIALTGNPRLTWDTYRRFVESYAAVVGGCPREPFEQAVRARVQDAGMQSPRELSARVLEELTRGHLERFARMTGAPLPQDPVEQLTAAVDAVLGSWNAPRAREYRHIHEIPDVPGTAVILQRMVFGNAGGVSGAGVGFTRDPSLGEPGLYMDFLLDAQGEDVVGGRHRAEGAEELSRLAPEVLAEIERACPRLEAEFGDAQEFELTVQDGELFLLQTRTAKRTPWAALRIATDQVRESLISPPVALARLHDLDLAELRRTHVQASDGREALCHATPASMGVASGPVAFDSDTAVRIARSGTPPVLVRSDAITEDLPALAVAAGLLTSAGSRTAHAAVIARELDKPCLVGCSELEIDLTARTARIGGRALSEGDVICLDAESGLVFAGTPTVVEERPTRELGEVAAWREAAGQDGRDTDRDTNTSDRR